MSVWKWWDTRQLAKWKHAGKIRSAMRVRENQRTVMPRASTPDDIIMATSSWELSVNISSSTLYISSCNHQRLSMSSLVLFFSFNTCENWDTKRSSDLHVFQGYCLLESGFKPKSYSFRTSRALLYPWVPSVWNWSRWVFPSLKKERFLPFQERNQHSAFVPDGDSTSHKRCGRSAIL